MGEHRLETGSTPGFKELSEVKALIIIFFKKKECKTGTKNRRILWFLDYQVIGSQTRTRSFPTF